MSILPALKRATKPDLAATILKLMGEDPSQNPPANPHCSDRRLGHLIKVVGFEGLIGLLMLETPEELAFALEMPKGSMPPFSVEERQSLLSDVLAHHGSCDHCAAIAFENQQAHAEFPQKFHDWAFKP
jgi:hypothetical protein